MLPDHIQKFPKFPDEYYENRAGCKATRRAAKKPKMKVSGKSVLKLQEIIKKKTS